MRLYWDINDDLVKCIDDALSLAHKVSFFKMLQMASGSVGKGVRLEIGRFSLQKLLCTWIGLETQVNLGSKLQQKVINTGLVMLPLPKVAQSLLLKSDEEQKLKWAAKILEPCSWTFF